MPSAPIVFLDFDGVTHPEVCRTEQLFTCLPLIESVLRRHPQAEIVISSSWREHHPLQALRGFFCEDMAARVVGCTPITPRLPVELAAQHVRESECRAWLTTHRPGHPWIAIDDVPWLFSPGCPHLLLTHHRTGFTATDAAHLQSVLEKTPQ